MLGEFMSHIHLCSFIPFQTVLCHSLMIELFLEDKVLKNTYFALTFSLVKMLTIKYKVIQNYQMYFLIK